jgi:hypothetical protein
MVSNTCHFLQRAFANAYICRWDTVCFGELRPIYPVTLGPNGEMLYSVHSRDPVVTHEEREERFIKLASKVTWGLTEGIIDPLTGRPSNAEWQGITQLDLRTDSIRCYVDVSKIVPLLRADLSVSLGEASCKVW